MVQGNEGRITVIKPMILRLPPVMGDECGGAIILSVQQNGSGPSGSVLALLNRQCGRTLATSFTAVYLPSYRDV